jgi:hypothetical protein
MLFRRPCRGFSYYCAQFLGLRAALRRFTPGYCSFGASGAKKQMMFWARGSFYEARTVSSLPVENTAGGLDAERAEQKGFGSRFQNSICCPS